MRGEKGIKGECGICRGMVLCNVYFLMFGLKGEFGFEGFCGYKGEWGFDGFDGLKGNVGLLGFKGDKGDNGVCKRGVVCKGFKGEFGNLGLKG